MTDYKKILDMRSKNKRKLYRCSREQISCHLSGTDFHCGKEFGPCPHSNLHLKEATCVQDWTICARDGKRAICKKIKEQ
jgi:hypothetical protein